MITACPESNRAGRIPNRRERGRQQRRRAGRAEGDGAASVSAAVDSPSRITANAIALKALIRVTGVGEQWGRNKRIMGKGARASQRQGETGGMSSGAGRVEEIRI